MSKLSDKEYEKAIVQLYTDPDLTEQQIQRAEFDLMVDNTLGYEFPKVRREKLFEQHLKLQNNAFWWGTWAVIKNRCHINRGTSLRERVWYYYSQVLTEYEFGIMMKEY